MKEFTLRKREEDFLKLNIGDQSFLIPLATSITLAEANSIDTMDGAIAFFRKYLGDEMADSLSIYDYKDIITAWKDASEKAVEEGSATPGES